jgi:hypothetical protein
MLNNHLRGRIRSTGRAYSFSGLIAIKEGGRGGGIGRHGFVVSLAGSNEPIGSLLGLGESLNERG